MGLSAWQRLIKITVPLIRNTTYLVLTFGMINAFQIFDQIAALSKQAPLGSPSGATSTMVTFLYQQSFSYMDMGYGSAAAVILFLIIFALSAVRRVCGKENSVNENKKEHRRKNSDLFLSNSFSTVVFGSGFYVMYNSLLPKRYIGSFVSPALWSLDNYKELFSEYPIMKWYGNTAISTVAVVLGNMFFTPLAGYGLARLRFPGKKVIFVCLMLSMMIPGQLVLLPQYIMMAKVGLVNTLFAITLPYLSQSMFIFMSRQFFYGIPEELEEAARIDGLGRFGTYFRIILPISGVLMATIAIFNFTGTWNSYLVPSTFISTQDKYVLVVGLQTVNNAHFQQENLTLAGVFLLAFPVIIFFMFTQRFFVQGIATSGIKS